MAKQSDNTASPLQQFVDWFRSSSPYIHAHRGKTFVIKVDGDAVASATFSHIIHDIALLNSLGIRLVLVHGARPQIEARLKERKIPIAYHQGIRITDDASLASVKEAVGTVRVEIEAQLSMGIANSPMSGAKLRVASGNFVTAKPLGVRDGVDYCYSGEVRKVDGNAIRHLLEQNTIVLLSPLGYSPTGEVLNLRSEEVATRVAMELQADKLFFLMEERGLLDNNKQLIQQLTPAATISLLEGKRKLSNPVRAHLQRAVEACRGGVVRTHLISRFLDGALLLECFSRDGIGTLVTGQHYEDLRQAKVEDVGGILALIEPLENEGFLINRSREMLEMEIQKFIVIERDGTILGCAALNPFEKEKSGELICLAVHPQYRNTGRGDLLLAHLEQKSRVLGIQQLFVLTTRTHHWFRERGFQATSIDNLPMARKKLYNYQRNSKVFIKSI